MTTKPSEVLLKTRNAFLLKAKPRSVVVEFGGEKIEVRQPTIGERARIIRESQTLKGTSTKDGDGAEVELKTDSAELQALAIICCSYLPGTDQRVFSPADREELKAHYMGSAIEELANAAIKLFNVKESDAAKKSGQTPTSTSGTSSPES